MSRRGGIMAVWLHQARAKHDEELGAPQPFPLTGDGVHTWSTSREPGQNLAGALADARYRDWLIKREKEARDRDNSNHAYPVDTHTHTHKC